MIIESDPYVCEGSARQNAITSTAARSPVLMIRLRVQEKACSEMTQLFEGSYSLPAAVPVIVGVTCHGGHGGDSRERSQEAMRLTAQRRPQER